MYERMLRMRRFEELIEQRNRKTTEEILGIMTVTISILIEATAASEYANFRRGTIS
jgi:hypothetical protein